MLFVDVIGGFTQDQGHANGCITLEERLLAETDDYSALSVRIKFNPWNAPWKQIARNRYLTAQQYPDERIGHVVCPYSYGVGYGLVKLAKHLDAFGMVVDVAVTCDGIYRHPWMKWRSLWGDTSIHLPDNVLAYHGFYQRKSRPMGVKPNGLAKELSWTQLNVIHVEMDDRVVWHNLCVKVVREMAAAFVGSPKMIPAGAPETNATESRLAQPKT